MYLTITNTKRHAGKRYIMIKVYVGYLSTIESIEQKDIIKRIGWSPVKLSINMELPYIFEFMVFLTFWKSIDRNEIEKWF